MIGRLRGTVLEKKPSQLLLDVRGVAYEIQAPMSTFYHLPDVGCEVTLHTHLLVREDVHLLYGFYARRDRSLFRTLIKVNGVGPKLALTVLSSLSPDDFVTCVLNQDIVSLTRVPGIGKKTAERLMIEVRDRLKDWQGDVEAPCSGGDSSGFNTIMQDAISALLALGYKPHDANHAVKQVAKSGMSSEDIIRLSLQGIMA